LAVVKFNLPPLCDRREDIPYLVDHFIAKNNARRGKNVVSVSPEVMSILMNHDFRGNIRELENIIEYAFVVCHGSIIQKAHLPAELHKTPAAAQAPESTSPLSQALDEESHIKAALRSNHGNQTKAAAELGIDRTTLWRKLRRYGISPSDFA
jgi:DNA-binding NtrC family response regulator